MKDTEQDKFDKLFQDKLFDFEAEPMEEDWELIAGHLPRAKSVPFMRIAKYVAAAAVLSFVMVTVTLFLTEKASDPDWVAQDHLPEAKEEIRKSEKELEQTIRTEEITVVEAPAAVSEAQASARQVKKAVVAEKKLKKSIDNQNTFINLAAAEPTEPVQLMEATEVPTEAKVEEEHPVATSVQLPKQQLRTRAAGAAPKAEKSRPAKKARGWGFGMGGGSLTAGTTNSSNMLFSGTRSPYLVQGITLMNMMSAPSPEATKTDVEHHTPVSFGFSVSKHLNERFSLQSGLVYTYLSSEWNTTGTYNGKVKQKLHYLGIPLSVVYKIAQWNKFVFYASAGGMGEINVAGKERSKMYVRDSKISETSQDVRMDEMLWSVNANVGVSYPLIRFINVFAETGASYYFDNGSDIETIRSDKPFNVNFQLGFRFGF